MKKLITTITLSFLTVAASSLGLMSQVKAAAPVVDNLTEITTETTFPTNPQPNLELSQTNYNVQLAYIEYACETYLDGSWTCCFVDDYGNWYCESGY